MRLRATALVTLALPLLLAGCLGAPGPATTADTPPAAPAFTAPPPGTITAGVVGATIGFTLSGPDGQRALAAEYQALQQGVASVPVLWQGSTSAVYGEVVPGPLYTINEYECRDYIHTIYANGVREAGRGTSCRTAGGPWTPVP
ncbi:MAG: hypothetical protein KIS68_03910 [Bauldia sp.]|nr:hypothetical protein [Bauldia sp.]